MTISKLVVVHGGELAKDVAEQLVEKKPANTITTEMICASKRPSALVDMGSEDTLFCFVLQTVENAAPTEEVSEARVKQCHCIVSSCHAT